MQQLDPEDDLQGYEQAGLQAGLAVIIFLGIAALLIFGSAALVVWIFWGWETVLGIGIVMVVTCVVLYSRPPWPF